MRRIGGIAIARKLLRDPPYADARQKIARQLGEIVARIHAVDTASLPSLPHREAADQVAACARRWTRSPSRSRCSSWRFPGSTGAGPPRPHGPCWCTAISAPATILPTKAV